MKRTLISIVVLLTAAGFLFGGGQSEAPAAEERAPVTSEEPAADSEEPKNPPIGEETKRLLEASGLRIFKERVPSIDFTLPRLEGGDVSLSDYRGSVVLLNFWATRCPPCREELPSMVRLQEELGDEGFTILAVSLREEREIVTSFLEENGFELPVLLDSSGAVEIGRAHV